MKTKLLLLLVLLLATSISSLAFQEPQDYRVLFEKAKYTMETKADLQEAINLFESLITSYPDEKEYAAKAQYNIGLCYEKLGLKEAQKAYRKVLDNYPEQSEAVKLANEKLSLLSRADPVIKKEDKTFNLRQVRADNELYGQGAPSPDGRYISYVHYDTGDLGILEIATGKKRRLTNKGTYAESDEFAEHSRWSADGKQIVYDWFNKEGFIELRIIGIDGSEPRILFKNEEVDWARTYGWSPDGKQILACFSRKGGAQQIVLVSAEDGSVGVLKILKKGWPKNMNFSPDGHYIVYDFPQKENSSERDIFLLSTDGSREITLVEHPADDFVLGWAPDGENILFASDRTGTLSAWLITVADGLPQGAPELVKPDIGLFGTMGFTRAGSFYYHIGGGFIRDVYFAKLDLETGKTLVPPKRAIKSYEGHNLSPDYSPDGKSLAYIRRIQDGDVLCIHSLETGEEREFHPKLKQIELPRWSPDGSSILVTGKDLSNRWGMYQIDALTGDVTTIVQNAGGGDWSPDGKDIFYARTNPDNLSQIMVREKESGAEKELYLVSDKGRLALFCSPDRNWLVFINWERGVLRVIPASGGEPRELYRLDKGERFGRSIAWTPDGKYIYFVISPQGNSVRQPEQNKCSLWRIPVEGGEPEKLGLEMSSIEHLSIHPDGQHIVFYTITSQVAAVWVMENFLPLENLAQKEEKKNFVIRKVLDGNGQSFEGGNPSPDGKYFAFTDWDTGNLAIYKSITGKKSLLTNDGSWESDHVQYVENSTWSPDGKLIVYDWQNETGSIELRLIGIDGSNSRILYKNEEWIWVQTFDWSADGKQILACFQRKDATRQIGLVNAENGSVRVLKTLVGKNWMNNMSFSPDGQYIVYDYPPEEYSQDHDIYVISADGGHEISLIKHPANDYVLGWVPDGKNILFASDRTGTFDAFVIQVANGKPLGESKLIKSDIGNLTPRGFTQKGSFYYSTSKRGNNVYTADLNPETGKILASPKKAIKRFEGSNGFPYYSSDGKYLAYSSVRNSHHIICIRNLETGEDREISLSQFNINRARSFRWSPDCSSILASGRDNKSGYGIFRMNVQTGNVTPIIPWENWKSTFIHSSELSPDGKTVFYVDFNTTDDWSINNLSQIMVRDLDTGAENELYRFDNYINISLSPDGKWLASSHPSSLKIMPAAGGEVRELYRFEEEYNNERPITWSADGKNILFSKKEPGHGDWELCRIPVDGGEPQKLELKIENRFTNLSAHPNGQKIAFSTSDQTTAEFWVMENFLPIEETSNTQ